MGRITVQFDFTADDEDAAPVPVTVTDATAALVYHQVVTLQGAELNRDFPPGGYLVRAVLPSGEQLAETVEVRAATADALFRTRRRSPRESLGWAYYLQRVPRATAPPLLPLGRSPGFSAPGNSTLPIVHFWSYDQGGWQPVAMGGEHPPRRFEVSFDPSIAAQFPGAKLVVEIRPIGNWRDLGRLWAQVEVYPYSRIIALPPAPVMHLYVVDAERIRKERAPFQVLVGGGSAAAQAMLGFLSSGDFESARGIGQDWAARAEEALHSKGADPVSAAVAAYYLLRAGELDRLHHWTANLANRFDWMPDGAVIRACHLMNVETPDAAEIRGWLLEAVHRGLPLYSQGLRQLYDGLALLDRRAKGADDKVAEALGRLRPYAAAALWHSPVTCFGGVDPEHPALHPDGEFSELPAPGL